MERGVGATADRDIDAPCGQCNCPGFRHCPSCSACLDCGDMQCDAADLPRMPADGEADHA